MKVEALSPRHSKLTRDQLAAPLVSIWLLVLDKTMLIRTTLCSPLIDGHWFAFCSVSFRRNKRTKKKKLRKIMKFLHINERTLDNKRPMQRVRLYENRECMPKTSQEILERIFFAHDKLDVDLCVCVLTSAPTERGVSLVGQPMASLTCSVELSGIQTDI